MKKYFIITDGSSLIEKEIIVDKKGDVAINKMYDAIDNLCLNINMALCNNKKEVSKLCKKWGFSE